MTLEEYRAELDVIDKTLEDYFVRRMKVVAKIGEYKRANGIPTLDAGLEPELAPYMEEYFKAMMDISKQYQNDRRSE